MWKNGSIASVRIKLSLDIASKSAMRNLVWVLLFVAAARAQYKFCAPIDVVNDNTCLALQKGDSEVSCLRVADSAECSIRLAEGEAHFGVFTAEELLLAYQFYPLKIQPILQLRHNDKQLEEYEFQTVAVIRADLTQASLPPGERLKRLRNSGFCHPGFSKSQWWNDYILKFFENSVNPVRCQDDVTVIENEVRNLRNFFGTACRPGDWAADSTVDQELKKKYPELCALCDNKAECKYNTKQHHGHIGALQCLERGNGKVAYVALNYVQEYFKRNESYQFLCPSGTVLPLSTDNPCAWLKQPWSVIASRKDIADTLKPTLLHGLKHPNTPEWKALSSVIQVDSQVYDIVEKPSISSYLSKGRDIDIGNIQTCGKRIRWCTIGDLETNKCKWVAKAAKTLGVAPSISCLKSTSTFQCLRNIEENHTDIMVIDSNYGYLARTVYGLSTILYSETEIEKNSITLAVVREPRDENYPIKSFQDIRGKKACFPEYGGLSWLSFIYAARINNLISSKSCDYPSLVSKLLSGACTPGIEDSDHSRTAVSPDIASKLCSICKHQNDTNVQTCAVNETNRYYSDTGALRCILEGTGDISFIEKANVINDVTFDINMYRVLCKNGSLAQNTGFNVDEICALSVTIDSE
ncbi:PREDICTED: transferrin-like isoform X2 [Vollenhovia emeryi]|nr:PREDICTED: transferrin-like isoform X2 [Vollenhovia emeryi]